MVKSLGTVLQIAEGFTLEDDVYVISDERTNQNIMLMRIRYSVRVHGMLLEKTKKGQIIAPAKVLAPSINSLNLQFCPGTISCPGAK